MSSFLPSDLQKSTEIAGVIVMGIFFDWMSQGTYEQLIDEIVKVSREKKISFKRLTNQIEKKEKLNSVISWGGITSGGLSFSISPAWV